VCLSPFARVTSSNLAELSEPFPLTCVGSMDDTTWGSLVSQEEQPAMRTYPSFRVLSSLDAVLD